MSAPTVECSEHGLQALRFVCIHVARATDSGEAVGFYWAEQEGSLPPIAWCRDCEAWLCQPRAEWNAAFVAQAQFVPFCEKCYDLAKSRLYVRA